MNKGIKKYKIDIAIKRTKTILDTIKDNKIGDRNILKKKGVYEYLWWMQQSLFERRCQFLQRGMKITVILTHSMHGIL